MAITKIKVENLTVFEEMEMEIDANVNVIIGENGTGKTQLLKFIYMVLSSLKIDSDNRNTYEKDITISSSRIFLGYESGLIRNESLETFFSIFHANKNNSNYHVSYRNGIYGNGLNEFLSTDLLDNADSKEYEKEMQMRLETVVFILAKDMLTHSKGLPAMKEKYGKNMPFDKIHIDTVTKALQWNLAEAPEFARKMVQKLEKIMDGVVIVEDEEFFILKNDGTSIPFHGEAEGIKKFGLLWQLLMNDNIKEGTILLWDEPEANINPKLIPVLADIILELGRNGVQIFLATHDYFLPKYIEVLAKEADKIAFHSLYKTDNGVKCEMDTKFSLLDENAIITEMVDLYEEEIDKGWE